MDNEYIIQNQIIDLRDCDLLEIHISCDNLTIHHMFGIKSTLSFEPIMFLLTNSHLKSNDDILYYGHVRDASHAIIYYNNNTDYFLINLLHLPDNCNQINLCSVLTQPLFGKKVTYNDLQQINVLLKCIKNDITYTYKVNTNNMFIHSMLLCSLKKEDSVWFFKALGQPFEASTMLKMSQYFM